MSRSLQLQTRIYSGCLSFSAGKAACAIASFILLQGLILWAVCFYALHRCAVPGGLGENTLTNLFDLNMMVAFLGQFLLVLHICSNCYPESKSLTDTRINKILYVCFIYMLADLPIKGLTAIMILTSPTFSIQLMGDIKALFIIMELGTLAVAYWYVTKHPVVTAYHQMGVIRHFATDCLGIDRPETTSVIPEYRPLLPMLLERTENVLMNVLLLTELDELAQKMRGVLERLNRLNDMTAEELAKNGTRKEQYTLLMEAVDACCKSCEVYYRYPAYVSSPKERAGEP